MNEALCEIIEEAFAVVRLGQGMGLREGQAVDDWADAATRARCRAEDEMLDWRNIPVAELNRCSSSLSFFDPEGMRFHLPAFLIADLQGKYRAGNLVFHLTYPASLSGGGFSLLSSAQRSAVRAYLLHVATNEKEQFSRADRRALESYWVEPETR